MWVEQSKNMGGISRVSLFSKEAFLYLLMVRSSALFEKQRAVSVSSNQGQYNELDITPPAKPLNFNNSA